MVSALASHGESQGVPIWRNEGVATSGDGGKAVWSDAPSSGEGEGNYGR